MKITHWDILHGDFGWRSISFLKLGTSDGIVGWAEYTDGQGSATPASRRSSARLPAG